MGHEPRGTSGTAVTVIVVLAVLAGLLLLGLLVLGLGAFFLVRSEARQVQQAVMVEQEAMSRLESAKAEAERARRGPADLAAGEARIILAVGRTGQLAVAGQMLTRDQLRQQISAAQDRGGPAVSVVIEAAEEAPFKAVADVQTLCHELGVRSVEMRLAPAAEAATGEPGEAP